MQSALKQVPTLDPKAIEDAIVGCSFPEGEQGMNVARVAMVLAGLPHSVGGVTVNRFCASGLTAIAMAADRIRVGEADVMIAGGAESMSAVPMSGHTPSFNAHIFDKDENIWTGTSSVGLNKLAATNRNYATFLPSPETTNENSNAIRALLEDRNGKIWVATKAGSIYQYDPTLTTQTTLIANGPKVYSLLQDNAGSVWMGTRGQGVIGLKNGNIGQTVNYRHSNSPGSLSSDDVFSILRDRKERLWVATFGNGLCVKTTPAGTAGFRPASAGRTTFRCKHSKDYRRG